MIVKTIETTRNNHYVPIWHQRGFLAPGQSKLFYLDFFPEKLHLPGRVITLPDCSPEAPKKCFVEKDLYTTSFFGFLNDGVEKHLFGGIDQKGALAARALLDNDLLALHPVFLKFFEYIDAQKIRTPKGLDWIKSKYPKLSQVELMREMQSIRQMNCTMWAEAVREIVSAEDSNIKFIVTDHPVTVYNPACPPNSAHTKYPNQPPIAWKGSQTVFPLDQNHCLILTNLEYARDPEHANPTTDRINARNFGQTITKFDDMIRVRKLKEEDVAAINYLLKTQARRHIAASKKEWLYPQTVPWADIGKVLLPPKDKLWHFGGEMWVRYTDGSVHHQDAFGRTLGDQPHLKKPQRPVKVRPNDRCICGSGRKYKKCCRDKPPASRPSSTELSIRERNITFFNAVMDILGLNKGKTWEDVRRDITDGQVRDIHGILGCLWPIETNIVDLLPKYDPNVFRALYAGLVDPRIAPRSVAGFSLFADEVLVMNPFTNPACVRPEYRPTDSPGQYRQETLKNVFLLMELAPFIQTGFVNMIPDPCDFNFPLREQIWHLAPERLKGWKPDPKKMGEMDRLFKEDFERSMMALPDESIKHQMKTLSPEMTDEQIEGALTYVKKKRLKDPLALLQPMATGKGGGEILKSCMSPNLELGLFLAQITGSSIYTDIPHRWFEVTGAVNGVIGDPGLSPWEPLEKCLESLNFYFSQDPSAVLEMRLGGKLGVFRKVFRKIFMTVQSESDPERIKSLALSLADELREVHQKVQGELEVQKDSFFTGEGKIQLRIPMVGFGLNTVHRLLVSHGGMSYLRSVPMAMFLEF